MFFMIEKTLKDVLKETQAYITEILEITKNNKCGEQVKIKVPDYIPELAKANPEHLGVCIITTKGQCFHAGKWKQNFTMQSIAKTITLTLALKSVGRQEVFSRVGMEPTGDAFNSIIKLEKKAFPFNPMINAGAISTASCCIKNGNDPYVDFLELVHKLCGRNTIKIDNDVYISEKNTGMRNRAMAYLMENDQVLKCKADDAVDFYFKTCSTSVNTNDLAHYAMILANNGKNPLNGESIIDEWIVPIIKTIMLTCGMYDSSGEFAVNVGMPAKSGVGGGIIACAENNMGIATFGPLLNEKGNSVGGVKIMEQLSKKFGLHMFSGKEK
jgi:glutaminase